MLGALVEFIARDLIAEILFKPLCAPVSTAAGRWLRRGARAGATLTAAGIGPAIFGEDRFESAAVALFVAGVVLWLGCGLAVAATAGG